MKNPKGHKKPTYIDLFCGAGGMTYGFEQSGFENLFSVDNEKTFSQTYRRNFPEHTLLEKDIANISRKEIENLLLGRSVDVVIGGPPCQGFSMAGNIGRRFLDDDRNGLFREFVRVVKITRPAMFIMENVARLYTHNGGETRKEIISAFEALGYTVNVRVLNSADYGVPQLRRRTVFLGSCINTDLSFPERTQDVYRTVRDSLKGMPRLKSGQKHPTVPNHAAMTHTEQMLTKMRYVKDGGGRETIPVELRPLSGDARKYIRYSSTKPSITVTGDMRKVFHPTENRALTVRELARLQSFEDTFIFEGSVISQQQQVGNAVPPLMAKALAEKIKDLLGR